MEIPLITIIFSLSLKGFKTENTPKYQVIHKSVKHFKNLQQIDYATDHGNSYVDRKRNCLSFFLRKSPRT